VIKLQKALYGLKQASRSWWLALSKSLKNFGFKKIECDAGVFMYKEARNFVIIIVYVDDILLCGSNKPLIMKKKIEFMKKWECRDLGEAKEFLSMKIERIGRSIQINQRTYLSKVLKTLDLQNAKSTDTPLPQGYSPVPSTKTASPELKRKYQSIIGSLLYLMLGTRPDIAFAVTKMAQFASNPSEEHLKRLMYIGRYLVGTQDYTLTYKGHDNQGLVLYVDSDWASDPHSRKSVSGYFAQLAGGAVSWTSQSQKSIALSSTEAEYIALSSSAKQAMWLKQLLSELKLRTGPVTICGDNQGSIFLASNPVTEKRSKHIDIKWHHIRELIVNRKIKIFYTPSAKNPADVLTKNLGRELFNNCTPMLGLTFKKTNMRELIQ
jgi:hypothetical protein